MPYPTSKKVINIKTASDKKEKKAVIIVDENENMYSFFRTEYQKDTPTDAYGFFCKEELKAGDTIGIVYSTNEKGFNNIQSFYKPVGKQAKEVVPFKSAGELAEERDAKETLIIRQVVAKVCGNLGLKYDDAKSERDKWYNYIVNGEPEQPEGYVDEKTIDLETMDM